MVQKSGVHQLRLVVFMPSVTRFYTSPVVQDFWTINSMNDTMNDNKCQIFGVLLGNAYILWHRASETAKSCDLSGDIVFCLLVYKKKVT